MVMCAGESAYKRRWEMDAPGLHRIASNIKHQQALLGNSDMPV
jgi:hypothetical protein